MKKFNGFKNYETWNVSLWIRNDESLYNIARSCPTYSDFADLLKSIGENKTPDEVLYGCCMHGYGNLDVKVLDEVIKEIK